MTDIYLGIGLALEIEVFNVLNVFESDLGGEANPVCTADGRPAGNKYKMAAAELLPGNPPAWTLWLDCLSVSQCAVFLGGFHAARLGGGEEHRFRRTSRFTA